MTLNASGPISLAGTTAGQSIQIENGGNGTTLISLNDAAVRSLAGVPSGAITMPTDFYGKSNRISVAATISANTSNYTVNTAKAPGYLTGKTDFTLTINAGVFISSANTGSYAMTVDTSWDVGDTVAIINNGTIIGRGGNGGPGGSNYGGAGSPGGSAGPALLVQRALTLTNGSGRISGGGGGGGGGNAIVWNSPSGKGFFAIPSGGGGGGGGIGNSSGGAGGFADFGASGSAGGGGSLTGAGGGGAAYPAGGGGTNPGGPGGSFGSSGSAATSGTGGAGGACIVGNSNITYSGPTGNRNGSIT
jgi:hypothetical protein